MRRRILRVPGSARPALCGLAGLVLCGWVCAALEVPTLSADIPAQPLPAALAEFAHQTGLQVIYVSKVASGLMSHGAHAGRAPADALGDLLDGTGLRFDFLNARTVRIIVIDASPSS